MARKVLNNTYYTFNPSTRTITIPQYIPQEKLILITNVTRDQVLFNFSDPSRLAASYNAVVNGVVGSTTIVLAYNTTTMLATDKLSIVIDEYSETFYPEYSMLDPVGKLRVSTPQSLIDTDFEYGNQVSKWEQIGLTNWHPASYNVYPPVTYTTVSSIVQPQGSPTVTVTFSGAHGLTIGTPIQVQDALLQPANGNFVIETIPTANSYTYSAKAINTGSASITNIFDPNKTDIWNQSFYTGAPLSSSFTISPNNYIQTVTTSTPHGLALGNEIAVSGITGVNAPNGNFFVTGIYSPTVFTYAAKAGIPSSLNSSSAVIYPRNQTLFEQRPFDGGVLFGANSLSNNQSATRQTRRNFHYQSGKGLSMNTGTIMKTAYTVDYLSVSGGVANNSTVVVQTREPHNLVPGVSVMITGVVTSGYNGTYNVNNVLDMTKFTYIASGIPFATPAVDSVGPYSVQVASWYGAATRVGIFNQQDGPFWEYDGTSLYAVLRSSIKQVGGRVSATNGSSVVTQTDSNWPTTFSEQLNVGQYIVIRGVSYRVTEINSDTSINISPPYRGVTNTYMTMTSTIDIRTPQGAFNIDRLDGTGPSGFKIDPGKMQMWYIDYAWYGAGTVRWGVRSTEGKIIYCHSAAQNNINTVAYMRSGNLPGRYENVSQPPLVYLASGSGIQATDSTIITTSTLNAVGSGIFPPQGTLAIHNNTTYEYVNYTSVTSGGFQGLTRGQAGNTSLATTMVSGATTASVTSTAGVQVGQRVAVSSGFPDNTFVTGFTFNSTISFSNAAYINNPTLVLPPMGNTAQNFSWSQTNPTQIELAYPSHAPYVSHWGTAVIMDGGYTQDKGLLFTYGMKQSVALASGTSRALLAIRVGPSVDQGLITSQLGARELVNRIQLQLQTLDVAVTASGAPSANVGGGNVLITAYLNSTPTLVNGGSIPVWTNAVGGAFVPNSSLSQICDYSSVISGVVSNGGEVTGGFFVDTTQEVDVSQVRDLGNSILGGGSLTPATGIYPDGPDVLTLVATNVGVVPVNVLGRISWNEAQA